MARGQARRQAAEGDIEQFLAAPRAQEAGETLGRGQRERPRAIAAGLSHFDEPRHKLRRGRDDCARTLAVRIERGDAAIESPYRIEGVRERRVAIVISAAEMPRQCTIVGVLADVAFAQEFVERTNGPRLSGYGVEQPFRRESFAGQESEFRRKPRCQIGQFMGARRGPEGRPMAARPRRRLGKPHELSDNPRHDYCLSMDGCDGAVLAFSGCRLHVRCASPEPYDTSFSPLSPKKTPGG